MYFYKNHARKRVFWKNLHSWHKFYMIAGRNGRDKSQLWSSGPGGPGDQDGSGGQGGQP